MDADETILKAIASLAAARAHFVDAVGKGLILGNDNHIGDIGEYWVRLFFENRGEFKGYPENKNAPYDIELNDGTKISVKTITEWSESGYGTQIKPLCGSNWQLLAAVYLGKDLKAKKISLVPVQALLEREPFLSNKISRENNGVKAYPRFQWWTWLDDYVAYLSRNKAMHATSA